MTLLVVGNDNLEEMMEPFYQDLEVPEYCEGIVTDAEKKRMMDYYKKKGKKFTDFDDCYAKFGEDWNFNRYRKDDDGVWRECSTSNPQMQWDWYEVGGRWPGTLKLKPGVKNEYGVNFSWGWPEEERKKFLKENKNRTDIARKGDVANLDELKFYAILINGEWIETSEDGWKFGSVAEFLKDVSDDTLLTCVDYHM